jgi:pimeloyl-ACP methyl ester carboxylesterase
MKLEANHLDIEVEDTASINPDDPDLQCRPVVLLIMGLGMQLTAWPALWVQELVDAGYRVIRFDNRDAGHSTCFDAVGKPSLLWAAIKLKLGLTLRPPYTLSDMAADALGVLDALEVQRAHIVGSSLGGMVAQRVALAAPERTISLTSIMSTSGAPGLPQAHRDVMKVLWNSPKTTDTDALVDYGVQVLQAIGSPAYPTPEPELRATVLGNLQRSYQSAGTVRQALAAMADGERAKLLMRIKAPTLVLHGKADPLVPYACGEDTAQRISGARLVGFDGVGHDLAPEPSAQMLAALIPHLQAADAAAPASASRL